MNRVLKISSSCAYTYGMCVQLLASLGKTTVENWLRDRMNEWEETREKTNEMEKKLAILSNLQVKLTAPNYNVRNFK